MGISKAAREEARLLHADGLKRCSTCHEIKAIDDFMKKAHTWDGLYSRCRACQAIAAAAQAENYRARWDEENADPYASVDPKRCADCKRDKPRSDFAVSKRRADGLHPLCRNCAADRNAVTHGRRRARWGIGGADPHADLSPKRCGVCRQSRPRSDFSTAPSGVDGLKALCKGCHASRESSRRARVLGQWVEYVDRDVLWARDRGICYLCGLAANPARWDIEHIQPVSHGGDHSYVNTAVSHPSCNYSKGSKPWPDVSWPEGDEILARLSA